MAKLIQNQVTDLQGNLVKWTNYVAGLEKEKRDLTKDLNHNLKFAIKKRDTIAEALENDNDAVLANNLGMYWSDEVNCDKTASQAAKEISEGAKAQPVQ